MTVDRVIPDPLVVQRQNDLFDLWHDFADAHADEFDYDPDDDPAFHERARQIMGIARTDATRSAVEDFTTDESDDDPSIDDILAMAEDDEDVERAAGHDTTPGHDQLHHYWTVDPEGRAKWVDSPKPWTTLVAHLTRHVGLRKAKIFASRWFIEVFGYAAGSDKNRVAHGHKPRGNRVGPG